MRVWTFGDTYSDLSIDNNGNITLVSVLQAKPATDKKWSYAGKIEDNFEYPYTVKLTQTAFYFDYKIWTGDYENGKTGTITFSNASNCSAIVPFYTGDRWSSEPIIINFKKN